MNTIKTSPYNPFDHLENDEEINEYLSTAFNDEDPHVFLIALGYLAKKRGMAEIARLSGVNRLKYGEISPKQMAFVPGHNPSQEAKCLGDFQRFMSMPISAIIFSALLRRYHQFWSNRHRTSAAIRRCAVVITIGSQAHRLLALLSSLHIHHAFEPVKVVQTWSPKDGNLHRLENRIPSRQG